MKNLRLQSAMEYLMTYGWSILIIAIVMVALYTMGVFQISPLGTACISQAGYLCQSPVLHGTTFNAVVGQASGSPWYNFNMYWVPQGILPPDPSAWGDWCPLPSSNTVNVGITCASTVGGLVNGQSQPVVFAFNGVAIKVGSTYTGQIWATYQLGNAANSPWYEVQIATVTLKAQ